MRDRTALHKGAEEDVRLQVIQSRLGKPAFAHLDDHLHVPPASRMLRRPVQVLVVAWIVRVFEVDARVINVACTVGEDHQGDFGKVHVVPPQVFAILAPEHDAVQQRIFEIAVSEVGIDQQIREIWLGPEGKVWWSDAFVGDPDFPSWNRPVLTPTRGGEAFYEAVCSSGSLGLEITDSLY